MSTTRYFSGSREGGKRSVASDLKRIEIQKGGKFSATDRYQHMLKATKNLKRMQDLKGEKEDNSARFKRLLNEKLEQNKKAASQGSGKGGLMQSKYKSQTGGMSVSAQNALKQMAMKKAAKEAKALRRMVLITPKRFHNGRITEKGKIFDVADNYIGKVHKKDGRITTVMGGTVGKYKPKSYFNNILLQDTINKYSPYFINLRKMQAMQQGAAAMNMHGGGTAWGPPPEVAINLYGYDTSPRENLGAGMSMWGDESAVRQGAAGTNAWGMASNNVWGTFSDNVWGTNADNVWGGTNNNIWGDIGAPSLWGQRGPNIWGTGNGKNYLQGVTRFIMGILGIRTGAEREARRGAINAMMADRAQRRNQQRSSSSSAPAPGGSSSRGGRR